MKNLWAFLIVIFLCHPSLGEEVSSNELAMPEGFFSNAARKNHRKTKNHILYPIVSYFLPGFAQYKYGQYGAGVTYSSLGALGLGVGIHGLAALGSNPAVEDIDSNDWRVRQALWGLKTYDLAGSLSTYHAFRTSVHGERREKFSFLGEGETTDQLMTAPARLDYFTRWTTIIPLTILTGGLIAYLANDEYNTGPVYGSDLAYSVGLSYNAGVGEEALFRGYLMPLMTDLTKSPFFGNLTTATVFALAHISEENPYPIPQFILGYYFGWLVQRNNWTLSEAIFVHTWWDIIVFSFNFSQGDRKAAIYVPLYQGQF